MRVATIEQILDSVRRLARPAMIAIDGRACSGKSTLAFALREALPAVVFQLDDFFIPFREQPPDQAPAFPFPYFRHSDFAAGIRSLRAGRPYTYHAYDWHNDIIATETKTVHPSDFCVVEGISALSSDLRGSFDLKLFVVSDVESQFQAAMVRDGQKFAPFWRDQWIPSEGIYFESQPWQTADFLYRGRGVPTSTDVQQYLR